MIDKVFGFVAAELFIDPKFADGNKFKPKVLSKIREFYVDIIANIFAVYFPHLEVFNSFYFPQIRLVKHLKDIIAEKYTNAQLIHIDVKKGQARQNTTIDVIARQRYDSIGSEASQSETEYEMSVKSMAGKGPGPSFLLSPLEITSLALLIKIR
ncbi:hypothetical protein HYW61_00875 [candidate division WWE3 bacterium]|nr:hypothetical protein [candidate division WWE3 bacterium]